MGAIHLPPPPPPPGPSPRLRTLREEIAYYGDKNRIRSMITETRTEDEKPDFWKQNFDKKVHGNEK